MSIFPCDICHKRCVGSLETIYLGLLQGATRFDRRLRLCPDDLDVLLQQHSAELATVAAFDENNSDGLCSSCESELGSAVAPGYLFATVYRRKSERDDRFGSLCGGCSEDAVRVFGLTTRGAASDGRLG